MTQPPGHPGSPDHGRDSYRSRHGVPVGYPPEDSGHRPADGHGYPSRWDTPPDRWDRPDPGTSEWGGTRGSRFGHHPEPWRGQRISRPPDPDTLLGEQPTTVLTAVPAADLDPLRDAPPTRREAAPRRSRASKAPFFGIITVVVLILGGFLLFNRSSWQDVPPDLAQPAKVVDRWLTAVFNSKNPEQTLRYTCRQEQDRAEVEQTIRSVRQAEKDARTARLTMKVAWARPVEVSNEDDHATVKTTLTVTVGKQTRETPAEFELVFEAGWRVCDADMT